MRCNIINPSLLTDQHLMAERRELRMIPPLLERRIKLSKSITHDIPNSYCLGQGHQKFWLNKFQYLEHRFNALTNEMELRGFHPNRSYTLKIELAIQYDCYYDWTPQQTDFSIILNRLKEKINLKFHWYRYYSKPITQEWFDHSYTMKGLL